MKFKLLCLWALTVFTAATGCDDNPLEAGDNPDGGVNGDTGNGDTDVGPAATLVGDIERNGNYVLEMTDGTDTVLFECTASDGGMILQMALNDENMLAEDRAMNGSIFWVAPQSLWNWPPPDALNSDTFTAQVDSATHTITLTGASDPELNIQVIKKFSPDLENFAIVHEYIIVNTGAEAASFAPWEISRAVPGGITFFPTGNEVNEVDMTLLSTTDLNGVTWFDHTSDLESGNYKYCADGSRGWLAHAFNNMVFVKSFEDQPAALKPPGQGEIQLYVSGGSYEEVEQMGAYEEIPAGGQTSWTLKWYIRNVPANAAVAVGNQELVDFVDNLVI